MSLVFWQFVLLVFCSASALSSSDISAGAEGLLMKIVIRSHLRARRAGLRADFSRTAWQRVFGLACGALFILAVPQGSAVAEGAIVNFKHSAEPGTIVVRTGERRLYLVLGSGKAIRYKVGVGRQGRQWTGESVIDGKYIEPNWAPPADVKRDRPDVPDMIPGGSPRNPLGAAAMTLSGGQYAIHGTNNAKSIGGFVSYGCIRMFNEDITDLYERVAIGSPVHVTP